MARLLSDHAIHRGGEIYQHRRRKEELKSFGAHNIAVEVRRRATQRKCGAPHSVGRRTVNFTSGQCIVVRDGAVFTPARKTLTEVPGLRARRAHQTALNCHWRP